MLQLAEMWEYFLKEYFSTTFSFYAFSFPGAFMLSLAAINEIFDGKSFLKKYFMSRLKGEAVYFLWNILLNYLLS